MYNRSMKKIAAAAAAAAIDDSTAKQLDDRNAKDKFSVDGMSDTEKMLEKIRDNKDCIDTTEVQLDAGREKIAESPITQKQIDKAKGKHRNDTADNLPVSPLAMLNAAQEQEFAKQYAKAEKTVLKDDGFWDEYAKDGDEYEVGPSQLQNVEDRFGDLSTDPNAVAKQTSIKEMVTASLRDADAMLMHIYVTAARDRREVTKDEQSIIDGINEVKASVLGVKIAQQNPLVANPNEMFGEMPNPVQDTTNRDPAHLAAKIDKLKALLAKTPVQSPDHDRIQREIESAIEEARGSVSEAPAPVTPHPAVSRQPMPPQGGGSPPFGMRMF